MKTKFVELNDNFVSMKSNNKCKMITYFKIL